MNTYLKKLDELANLYNKTNNPKYKEEWYKLIRKLFNNRTLYDK